jgi:hypothetical protein
MSNGSERNFDRITSLFSNCTPENGATENNKVMTPKSHLDSRLITYTTLCCPLRGCPTKEQFWTFISHIHDTCEACQSKMCDTYVSLNPSDIFNRTMHIKNVTPHVMESIITIIQNPNQELNQVVNQPLGKPNLSLNNFNSNLEVD